jgi:hypothetical protein
MSLNSDLSSDESKETKKPSKKSIPNLKQSESPSLMTNSLSSKLCLNTQSNINCIYWFRKALRLHGNTYLYI